jgi:uncharacterized protein YndB with AHSA1/START domain
VPHAERTITVARPIEEVFDFFADGRNNPRWRPGVIEIALAQGSGAGAVYSQKVKGPGGRPVAADYKVTVFERPARLEFDVVAGPARPHGAFDLTSNGGFTTVHFTLDIAARGLMRLMSGVITKTAQAEVACLDNVKAILEAPGS